MLLVVSCCWVLLDTEVFHHGVVPALDVDGCCIKVLYCGVVPRLDAAARSCHHGVVPALDVDG